MYVAVVTLGLSPPIATEFLMHLAERDVEIDKLVAVTTAGAEPSFWCLKMALYWSSRVPEELRERLWVEPLDHVDVVCKRLTMDDITRPEHCRSFRTQFSSAIKDALKWSGQDQGKVYVCIAGGRKTMPVDALLVSMANGLTNVYHVVAPTVPGIAEKFASMVRKERRTDEEEAILKGLESYADRPGEAPEELARYALEVCFPPRGLEVHLLPIPVPRLPEDIAREFRKKLF